MAGNARRGFALMDPERQRELGDDWWDLAQTETDDWRSGLQRELPQEV